MKSILAKNKMVYLLLLLVLLHAATVVKPLFNIEFSSNRLAQDVSMVIQSRQHEFSEAEASMFSRLFAIEPISFELKPEVAETEAIPQEPPPELLSAKQPRLLAIDKISDMLTARILLRIEGKTEMKSLRLGDELYGYKLTAISMHNVNFELVNADQANTAPAQLHLKIFSREQ